MTTFIRSTLQGFTRTLSRALLSERVAHQSGFLQQFDPRVRVVGMMSLVISVVICRNPIVVAALFLLAVLIAVGSKISLLSLVRRVWIVALGFSGLIALPALFTTPGDVILSLPVPFLVITSQGLRSALLLILRVETAVTFTTVLVLATPWAQVLKVLRWLRLPAEVVTMLAMTHRYIFLLLETANHMFESRESRTVGLLKGAESRQITARTAGVLLSKSMEISQEVYLAMLSRGFRGEIHLLHDFRMRRRDYAGVGVFLFVGCLAAWAGR